MTDIILRTGGICVIYKNDSIVELLTPLMESLTEYRFDKDRVTRRMVKTVKAKFYIHNTKHKMLLFHTAHMEAALALLRTHPDARKFKVDRQDPSPAKTIDINYTSPKTPRKRQPEYIDFLTDLSEHIRILPSSPGSGKTLCTINSMTRLKVKTAIILAPALKDNWVSNLIELTDLEEDDILYVSGGDGLHSYMRDISEGEDNYKVVIFSINTMQSYMTGYLEDDLGWLYTPDDLFDAAGFGLKVVDEAHRWMNFHMMLDMYSNIKLHISLTGTLMQESPFLATMETDLFPLHLRCPVDPPVNHVKLRTYQYSFKGPPPKHIGAMGYNHMTLESTIFKNKKLLAAYLRFIGNLLYSDFYKSMKGKDRAVVFFSTVNMVTAFEKMLKEGLPDLKVVSYLAGDSESKYDDANVIVTTTKKAGTGTDFSDLIYVLQTIMISSKGENTQVTGRLRERKDGNTTFAYIWASDIPKHLNYHKKRLMDLKPMVCSIENVLVSQPIG